MTNAVWQRAAECVSTRVGTDLVLLDVDGGQYFSMNGPAADVWEIIATPSTQTSLVDALVRKYAVAPEECAKSVARLLDEFSAKGLARQVG